jgi:hypothetical protein
MKAQRAGSPIGSGREFTSSNIHFEQSVNELLERNGPGNQLFRGAQNSFATVRVS